MRKQRDRADDQEGERSGRRKCIRRNRGEERRWLEDEQEREGSDRGKCRWREREKEGRLQAEEQRHQRWKKRLELKNEVVFLRKRVHVLEEKVKKDMEEKRNWK